MTTVERSAAMTLEVLPARMGDCVLLECHREQTRPWRVLIDGGPPDCWPRLRSRLLQLPEGDRHIDVVVVTHIDSDHIGGIEPLFDESEHNPPGLTVGDVWFNAPSLDAFDTSRGFVQGQRLVGHLGRRERGWNEDFAGGPVMTDGEAGFTTHLVPDGPRVTVLSPTAKRLDILNRRWERRGDELHGALPPPAPLPVLEDLVGLANTATDNDTSQANGSSIALLVEHRGASCLLAADAFPNVLGSALLGLAQSRGAKSLPVDVFKLPHHGSQANLTPTLLALAPASHYVVSTNGDRYDHPDDVALARVVTAQNAGIHLWFNYRNSRTERWADPALERRHRFRAKYPEPGTEGLRLKICSREREGRR